MQATLTTHAAFLVAAKRRGRIKLVKGVGPDHAGTNASASLEISLHLCRSRRRLTIRTACCWLWRSLHHGSERLHRKHRPKNFFLHHAVGLRHAGEQGRTTPIARFRDAAGRLIALRPLPAAPIFRYDLIRSSCSLELIAPMSVFLSSGSPTISVSMRSFSLRMNFFVQRIPAPTADCPRNRRGPG